MKISELSRETDVPVASIKFYLREGLLQPGTRTAVNQADYGEQHVARLKFIRAMRDVAGMSLATIGEILAVANKRGMDAINGMAVAIDALALEAPGASEGHAKQIAQLEDELRSALYAEGWLFRPQAAAVTVLAKAIQAARDTFDPDCGVENVMDYARGAMRIAQGEMVEGNPLARASQEESLVYALLGTVLFEPVILALRRLALESLTVRQLSPEVLREVVASASNRLKRSSRKLTTRFGSMRWAQGVKFTISANSTVVSG